MAKQSKFMAIHRDPRKTWEDIEKSWAKAANVESATWIRTYFNRKEGVRFCLWMAQGKRQLEEIFNSLDVSWESILEVEETIPDLWGGRWEKHIEAETAADTLAF